MLLMPSSFTGAPEASTRSVPETESAPCKSTGVGPLLLPPALPPPEVSLPPAPLPPVLLLLPVLALPPLLALPLEPVPPLVVLPPVLELDPPAPASEFPDASTQRSEKHDRSSLHV